MSSNSLQAHFLIFLLLAYYYFSTTHTTTAATGNDSTTVQCLPDQAWALLQLKRSFHNPSLPSWQHGTDCCRWEGVGCDTASGEVIILDLGGRNLQSTSGLSPAIFNLTSLTNLSLAANDFSGAILPKFGFERLAKLISLDLSNAGLAGQIPIGISHLANLRTLDLSTYVSPVTIPYIVLPVNDIYFQDPKFETILANLSNLRELYLDNVPILSSDTTWSLALADSVPLLQDLSMFYCGLYGPVHHSFSRLHFLETIYLRGNEISGKFPGFFAEFSSLSILNLGGNNLEGQFPPKIFQLENLRSLCVSFNSALFVQLPDFPLGNNLEELDLRYINITGALPASFIHLQSLKHFALSNIKIPQQLINSTAELFPSLETLWLAGSGTEKPELSWIGRIKHLSELTLVGYNISGPIPPSIQNCTSLASLTISECGFSGTIPLWIGNLTKLSSLDFSVNSLTGEIPKVLFSLPLLDTLSLDSNELDGPLKEIPDPSSSLLQKLDLTGNRLTGNIPKSFFGLTRLRFLELGLNHFEGTVDLSILGKLKSLDSLMLGRNMLSVMEPVDGYSFRYLPNLRHLDLASCNLKKIPGVLRYANELENLDLSNNQISGVIPSWIWVTWKVSLYSLDLSGNMFNSLENNPSVLYMDHLQFLDLSSNKLHGNVPIPITVFRGDVPGGLHYSNNNLSSIIADFGRYLSNRQVFDLSHNKLSGKIPISICTQTNLEVLDLSYNNFSGKVPSCLIQGDSLSILSLRENNFHGIPENIEAGCMLQTIDLNSNQIGGKVPRSLSNCRSLEVLDIGNNHIVDSFPHWLGNMPNLRVLIFRSNQFHGSIGDPTESDTSSKHFPSLQIIDLASNNLSGRLHSRWFEKLEMMMINSSGEGDALRGRNPGQYYQETITFKGMDLTYTKILTTFKVIDFSDNAFHGPIPESIGKLIALHGLNMSHNAFTGTIPWKLGGLAQMESLDLSQNKLSGPIPRELAALTYLAVLNLSYNNLSGMIPQGPQFSSFTNSSFQGNPGLCGSPLSKQCKDSSNTTTPSSSASSRDRLEVILLYVFAGSGFGVGFAAAIVFSAVCRAKWWWNLCHFQFHH